MRGALVWTLIWLGSVASDELPDSEKRDFNFWSSNNLQKPARANWWPHLHQRKIPNFLAWFDMSISRDLTNGLMARIINGEGQLKHGFSSKDRTNSLRNKEFEPTFEWFDGKYDAIVSDSAQKRDEKQKKSFSSWGGKRNSDILEITEDQQKRSPVGGKLKTRFSSWGGKRNTLPMEADEDDMTQESNIIDNKGRNTRFTKYGGQQDELLEGSVVEINKDVGVLGKRGRSNRFSSWGGKRDQASMETEKAKIKETGLFEKRGQITRFSSWGGKRDTLSNLLGTDMNKESNILRKRGQKTMFSSWGGKRTSDVSDLEKKLKDNCLNWEQKYELSPTFLSDRNSDSENGKVKRGIAFSSWGGKRYPEERNSDEGMEIESGQLDNENSFNKIDLLRTGDTTVMSAKRSPKFLIWGKKRGPTDVSWNLPEIDGKRPAFSSWGGKRSGQEWEMLEKKRNVFRYPGKELGGGKRRPVFSSWGGKRALTNWREDELGNETEQEHSRNKRGLENAIDPLSSDILDCLLELPPENDNRLTEAQESKVKSKRSGQVKSKQLLTLFNNKVSTWGGLSKQMPIEEKKNSLFQKVLLSSSGYNWAMKPMRRGSDFYPWGGKRTSTQQAARPNFNEELSNSLTLLTPSEI